MTREEALDAFAEATIARGATRERALAAHEAARIAQTELTEAARREEESYLDLLNAIHCIGDGGDLAVLGIVTGS